MIRLDNDVDFHAVSTFAEINQAWPNGAVVRVANPVARFWIKKLDRWFDVTDIVGDDPLIYSTTQGALYAPGSSSAPAIGGGGPGLQGPQGIPGPANLTLGRVAADIPQSSNVTFSNLFTQAVLANEVFSFEAVLFFTSAAATTGIVVQVDTPASPIASQCQMLTQTTATAMLNLPAAANATMTGTAALISPTVNTARVVGTVENGANAGNLVVKFRSEVNASAITVKRGSFVRWFKH